MILVLLNCVGFIVGINVVGEMVIFNCNFGMNSCLLNIVKIFKD